MQSTVKQNKLQLAFGVHHAPKDAPAKLLRQIESDAQALAVSMRAGGHKLAYIAACIGKSEAYVCQMRRGVRPIPGALVGPLCAATGTNLLAQYRALCAALEPGGEVDRLAAMLRAA